MNRASREATDEVADAERRNRFRKLLEETKNFYDRYAEWIGESILKVVSAQSSAAEGSALDPDKVFRELLKREKQWGQDSEEFGNRTDLLYREYRAATKRNSTLKQFAEMEAFDQEFSGTMESVKLATARRLDLIRTMEAWRDDAAEEILKIDTAKKLQLSYNPSETGSRVDGHI